jgi:hypothetical protein
MAHVADGAVDPPAHGAAKTASLDHFSVPLLHKTSAASIQMNRPLPNYGRVKAAI